MADALDQFVGSVIKDTDQDQAKVSAGQAPGQAVANVGDPKRAVVVGFHRADYRANHHKLRRRAWGPRLARSTPVVS
jgi:hypothetical protein